MTGYNHYSWCMCGWCYNTGRNGYSQATILAALPRMDAERRLDKEGARRSWSACFITPNATCPVCGEQVWYYENVFGSRVFFDDIGHPWPKHPCTDNAPMRLSSYRHKGPTIERRKLGEVQEIMEAAWRTSFDPNAAFRSKYGHRPWDLLQVTRTGRVGLQNFVEGESISPPLEDQVYLSFVSAKIVPIVGEFLSFDGEEVAILDVELVSRRFKARRITREEFLSACESG